MKQQMVKKRSSNARISKPSGEISVRLPTKEESRGHFYERVKTYNPDFAVSKTPSIEACVDIILEDTGKATFELTRRLKAVQRKWKNKKNFGINSLNKAISAAFDFTNDNSKSLDSLLEAYNKPPRNLKKTQKSCFKEMLATYINFFQNKEYYHFALSSSPCFFEPSDLNLNLSHFLEKGFYKQDKQYGGFKSRNIRLRESRENPAKIQKVDASLFVNRQGKIDLKYVVYNHQDKFDVVAAIEDSGVALSHYDLHWHTPRGDNEPANSSFQIIGSSRTGDFTVRTESKGETGLFHRDKDEMEAEDLFKFITKNPVFLGGNVVLYLSDFVRANRAGILKASEGYKHY